MSRSEDQKSTSVCVIYFPEAFVFFGIQICRLHDAVLASGLLGGALLYEFLGGFHDLSPVLELK